MDFSLYKSPTIQRRITRRLVLNKQDRLESYARFLRGNAKELDALYSDALISVTSFFRNPKAFDVLKRTVFPKLLRQGGDEPFRVWVLGCSTGQEAYSIAMAFVEAAENAPRMRKLQVFATDLNDALLAKARHGLYAKSLADDVSLQRLRRFFVEEEGGYRVRKPLREMVVFARQNLIADPPFSRMDLISCRNLLIYLEPSLQKRALPTFHYALKPGGFLFLGASESIGGFTDLFEPVDKKHRIYSRKAAPTPALQLAGKKERGEHPSPGLRPPSPHWMGRREGEGVGFHAELNAQREADRISVGRFAPPAVLIDAELQILQFRGPTGAYLEPPTGKASFEVLKMAREGLMLPLRTAINRAKKENKTVRKENVRVEQNGQTRLVNLEVIPLKNLRERCFLILFEEAGPAGDAGDRAPLANASEPRAAVRTPRPARKQEESRRVADLEREIAEMRDYLQSLQEQYEAANEELQASSEEVQSANEELQSVNEELETSKEELESTNEELTTVNEEMVHRNTELIRLNSDLINLQTATKLAVVLLGRDLTIRRFSAQADKQFDLRATDVGRPIGHVRHNLVFADPAGSPADLESLSAEVIETVREQEREVRDKGGRWYSLRVRPYLTLDNKVDGAVLVLVDIDALKRSEHAIAAARDYTESTVATVREPLLVLDKGLHVENANRSFYRAFRVAPAETVGRFIYDLGNRQWDIPRLRTLLEDILRQNSTMEDFEVEHDFPQLGHRSMLLNARQIRDPQGKSERVLLAIEDITERKQAEQGFRQRTAQLETLLNEVPLGVYLVGGDFRIRYVSATTFPVFGDIPDLIGRDFDEVIHILWPKAYADEIVQLFRHTLETGEPYSTPERVEERLDRGVTEIYEWQINRIPLPEGGYGVVCYFRDIAIQARARAAIAESKRRLQFVMESAPQKIFTAKPNGDVDYFNPQWSEFTGLSFEQIQDWGWTQFIHPDDLAENIRVWQRSIDTGEPFLFEHRFRRADGEYRWHIGRALPMRDAEGRTVMWIGSDTDIHEQRQTENRLRQLTTDLAESDRRKDEFLAMLAHELRNPLAPIRNALQVMRLQQSGEGRVASGEKEGASGDPLATRHSPLTTTFAMMERQIGQMVRLVDDLLDVSRISRGKIELRGGRIELASVVNHAVEAARPLLESGDHELTVTLPPQPIYLHGDPTRLAQVVGNLLSNACKFTDKGDRIWLTVEREDAQAVIRVRDTGIGIAADQLPRIFDMFMQVDTSLERSVGGLGVGLTLVKNLVEMHGGAVEVHSAGVGQGSEFVVRLPVLVETPKPEPTVSEPTPTAARRILLVDDNRDSAESLAMLLTLAGNETHTAHDGLEAVEAAAAFRPDVVLLDIGLPKLNGYEACRRIREQPWGKTMVLVAVTGWGQEEDRRKSKDAGFDAHMVKPVDYAALMKLLASLTSDSGIGR